MRYLYLLEHSYVFDLEDQLHHSSLIGIYSSREKAEEAVNVISQKPGFHHHPNLVKEGEEYQKDGFFITPFMLDQDRDKWKSGFIIPEADCPKEY